MPAKSKTTRKATAAADLLSFAMSALAKAAPETAAGDSPEAAFLRSHAGQSLSALPKYFKNPAPADVALIGLAGEMDLKPIEVLSVALAAAAETDVMAGRAIARVQAPLAGSRPTPGLLATAFASLTAAASPIGSLLTGAAFGSGLLALLNEGAPASERPVAVPLPLSLALGGQDAAWPGATTGLGSVPGTILPPSIVLQARRHAAAVESGGARYLVVRSSSVSEGRSVVCALAEALGRRALFLEPNSSIAGLAPLLLMRKLIPVFSLELGPGERKSLPPVAHYNGPVLALCGPDGSPDFAGEPTDSLIVPVPPRDERRELWIAATGDEELATTLALHHRHGCGRIAHLGRLARHRAALDRRAAIVPEDIAAAAWIPEGSGLGSLAQPLPDAIPEGALVTTEGLRHELERLYLRCLVRDGLADRLGVSAGTRYCPGVRALFTGASGTGKTLAAGWLAARLGLPLYRVDLASITSKYIGETEKNLAQLMARAEHAEVALLFDEADSLFARRTEVREANDRFANAQTNYLLQRIESFEGIAILTANSRARFDPAFARRLDALIEFPIPGPEERRRLWQSHLGEGHSLTVTELNQLAAAADLCGGNIRNVVISAAAAAQGASRGILFDDILDALGNEFRKLSRQVPAELTKR